MVLWGIMGTRGRYGVIMGCCGVGMGRHGALWAPCGAPSFMVLHHAAMVLGCFPIAMVSLRGALGGDRG